jgi:hypothetical protein
LPSRVIAYLRIDIGLRRTARCSSGCKQTTHRSDLALFLHSSIVICCALLTLPCKCCTCLDASAVPFKRLQTVLGSPGDSIVLAPCYLCCAFAIRHCALEVRYQRAQDGVLQRGSPSRASVRTALHC